MCHFFVHSMLGVEGHLDLKMVTHMGSCAGTRIFNVIVIELSGFNGSM